MDILSVAMAAAKSSLQCRADNGAGSVGFTVTLTCWGTNSFVNEKLLSFNHDINGSSQTGDAVW